MMFVIGLVVGTIIGWLVPQPQWAKDLFAKIKEKATS